MRIGATFFLAILGIAHAASFAEDHVPAFTGVWKLDLKQSQLETKHPPIASIARINYDGKMWKFSRTHSFAHGKVDKWSTTMIVDAKEDRVEKDGPLTSKSRVTRDGNTLLLREDLSVDSGEHGTNTVRYSLSQDNNTLTEDEREVGPDGTEHNIWILQRKSDR